MAVSHQCRTFTVGLAAIAASLAEPVVSSSTASDADLIAACDRVHAANANLNRLFKQRLTLADEERTEAELDQLWDAVYEAHAEVEALLPPTTIEGLIAVARVSLADWPPAKSETRGFHTVAAVSVLQAIVGRISA